MPESNSATTRSASAAVDQIAQQHGELFASGAGHSVRSAKASAKAIGQLLEAKIADRVTVGVVDLLEAVEVEADDSSKIAVARGRGQSPRPCDP